jgi:hypothetical protein
VTVEPVQRFEDRGIVFLLVGNTNGNQPTRTELTMDTNILSLLSSTPVTLYALQKASGLSQTALTMALVALGGKVAIQDGGLVLAPEPTTEAKEKGPRGPTAKTLPRQSAAREALLAMARGPEGVTAKALLEASNGAFVYTDILLVAREEMAKGTIGESRKGRKATWIVPGV